MTTPSFVDGTLTTTSYASSLQPNAPASMVANNLLLCIAFNTTGSNLTFSFPSPWSVVETIVISGRITATIAAAICTGSGMAMPNVTWGGVNTSVGMWVSQYTGNLSTLSAAIGNSNNVTSTNSNSTATNPGLTTSNGNSLVVSYILGAAYGANGTPTGYTPELATTFDDLEVADVGVATSGNSAPAVSEAMGNNTWWITAQVEVCSEAALILDAAPGSYTITGEPVANYLFAVAGSYTITGDAANLQETGIVLDAAAGSYTITGDAALLYRNVTGTWASTEAKDIFAGAGVEIPGLNLDGYVEGGAHDSSFGVGITSASVTLSTTYADDVIVLMIESGGFFNSAAVTSITDTAGLTWKRRQQRNMTGNPLGVSEVNASSVEIWWAHAPDPLSADVITVHTGTTGAISIIAAAVCGANYTTPWDTNQRAGWATDSYGFGNPTGTLSTDAVNTFVLAFYSSNDVPDAGAMNSGSPFTYVTTASEAEIDGETQYISFAAVLSEAAQNAYGPIYFEQTGGINNRMLMMDAIVSRSESGTADAVLWFLDGGTATNTAIINTTDPLSLVTAVEQSMTVYNAETVVVVVAVIISASGLGEVQSVEDVSGHSPWQRRSRKTNSTGSIAIEVWWAPWITGENENGITVTPMNVENNDSISMLVFAVGGATGFFTGNYWDSNASLPATGTSESGGVPAVTDMTSDVGNALALAFTTNITVPFNNGQNSVLPFVGETPDVIGPFNSATYPPPLWLVGAAPPVNVAVQFSFTHAALSDETAQFFSSPEPQYSVTIGDVLTVGPPQPPVGVWGSTEAQDKFTHAGDYTSIGIASPGGWVGVLPTHGTWASTEATDKTTGAPAQAPYDSIGWLGWVPAHCTWASTERKDIWSAGGWVIGHPVTGRWTSAESRDRMAFSEYTLGAVSGTWGSTDTPDRMASVGFEVPTTVPVVPRNRKRMLIIS